MNVNVDVWDHLRHRTGWLLGLTASLWRKMIIKTGKQDSEPSGVRTQRCQKVPLFCFSYFFLFFLVFGVFFLLFVLFFFFSCSLLHVFCFLLYLLIFLVLCCMFLLFLVFSCSLLNFSCFVFLSRDTAASLEIPAEVSCFRRPDVSSFRLKLMSTCSEHFWKLRCSTSVKSRLFPRYLKTFGQISGSSNRSLRIVTLLWFFNVLSVISLLS